jgi:hypothetical protein
MVHEEIANLYHVKGFNDHIVEVFGVYEDKKQIHIVTELISGTLRRNYFFRKVLTKLEIG